MIQNDSTVGPSKIDDSAVDADEVDTESSDNLSELDLTMDLELDDDQIAVILMLGLC